MATTTMVNGVSRATSRAISSFLHEAVQGIEGPAKRFQFNAGVKASETLRASLANAKSEAAKVRALVFFAWVLGVWEHSYNSYSLWGASEVRALAQRLHVPLRKRCIPQALYDACGVAFEPPKSHKGITIERVGVHRSRALYRVRCLAKVK